MNHRHYTLLGSHFRSLLLTFDFCYCIGRSRSEFVYDEETERQRLNREKNAAVEAFEDRIKTALKGDEQKKGFKLIDLEKMGMKFLTSIIDNLVVDIKNIHFRYVDKTSFSQCPFVFGACIDSIQIPFVRKDPKSKSKPTRNYVVKELSLSGLSVYTYMGDTTDINSLFNKSWTDTQFKTSMHRIFRHVSKNGANEMTGWHSRVLDFYQHYNPAKLRETAFFTNLFRQHKGKEQQLLDLLISKYGPEPPQIGAPMFVLHPVSAQVQLKFNKDTNRKVTPLFEIAAQFGTLAPRPVAAAATPPAADTAAATSPAADTDAATSPVYRSIEITLTPSQFGAVAAMAESLTNYRKYAKYRQFRPRRTEKHRNIRPDKSQRVSAPPGSPSSTRPSNPMAKRWWSYAIQAIMVQNRQKRRSFFMYICISHACVHPLFTDTYLSSHAYQHICAQTCFNAYLGDDRGSG